jgi:hypothetical protein
MMDREQTIELKKIAALAKGLRTGFLVSLTPVPRSSWEPYIELVKRLEKLTGDDLSALRTFQEDLSENFLPLWSFNPKLAQFNEYLALLEQQQGDPILQIGSLYNSIQDSELRSRCADLLSLASHFDRVINQATLVLEERIRRKAGCTKGLTGTALAGAYIKTDPSASPLVFSDDAAEQEGMSFLCKGLMLTMRNPTHHSLIESFTREEAFHICGFIDRLLKLIDGARAQP